MSRTAQQNTRIIECRACNGYCRLPDQPGSACRYCNGKGYARDRVTRPLTDDEQAYIQSLIADGTLDSDWND